MWPSTAGGALRSATFYATLQTYFKKAGLPPAGVHIFRHSAAKLRRDAGESIEQPQAGPIISLVGMPLARDQLLQAFKGGPHSTVRIASEVGPDLPYQLRSEGS